MKLTTNKVTFNVVDFSDLEELINEYYGQDDFNIAEDLETRNDTYHEITVKKCILSKNEQEDIEIFRNKGKHKYLIYSLMADLCNNDIIEEGLYLINISW